jgi:hypothetical protein
MLLEIHHLRKNHMALSAYTVPYELSMEAKHLHELKKRLTEAII